RDRDSASRINQEIAGQQFQRRICADLNKRAVLKIEWQVIIDIARVELSVFIEDVIHLRVGEDLPDYIARPLRTKGDAKERSRLPNPLAGHVTHLVQKILFDIGEREPVVPALVDITQSRPPRHLMTLFFGRYCSDDVRVQRGVTAEAEIGIAAGDPVEM